MFSKDEIKLIVPGNRVRSKIYPFLLDLNDREWATIIYQSNMPLPKKNSLLNKLQSETQNSEVKMGIAEYLNSINRKIVAFAKNEYNKFVYSLYSFSHNTKNYIFTSHDYNVVCKYIDQHEDDYFIYKNRLIDFTTNDIPDEENVIEIKDGYVSSITMSSSEFDIDIDSIFYINIFKMINPFERGDIVTLARDHSIFGIINTKNEDWNILHNRHKEYNIANEYNENAMLYEFNDEHIIVETIDAECNISYDHLNILELELLEENDIIELDIKQERIISMISKLYKGENIQLENLFNEYEYLKK